MPDDIAQLVLDHWRSENIPLKEPVSQNEIVECLASLGVSPSSELLEADSIHSRFDDDEIDEECLSFWSLKKVSKENRRGADAIQFADFLIDSHRYTFTTESDNTHGIYVDYLNGEKIKIADSFASFFQHYLESPRKLFP